MNQLLYYLLQVTAASGILYGYYHWALRNKRFHRYNRFYLLTATIISIVIPFINIPVYFITTESDSSFVLQTLSVISSSPADPLFIPVNAGQHSFSDWFTHTHISYMVYTLVSLLFFAKIIFSLKRIKTIARNNPVERLEKINFVNTNEPGTPFSFFRWMFWNRKIELHSEKGEQIFRHELFHIQQKHSWDIFFLEILTVVFWLNPFFHLVKKELKAIHEFLADEFAINKNEKWQYAELLLMQALNTQIHLVNPFFHNQIKRRIAMITSSQKPGHQYLRKLLVLPVAATVVALFAFSYIYKKNNESIFKANNPITIVVDAGHGGTDPGAKSTDGKYTEAQLSLEIAKAIQRLAPWHNVNVVMTREDEHFPGGATDKNTANRKRAEINNETNPDAFISVHVSTSSKSIPDTRSGIDVYVTNKRENQHDIQLATVLIQAMKNVYTTREKINQRQDAGIFVLDKANTPSVLVECGYINNPKDLAFLLDKNKQEELARAILNGLVDFSNNKSSKIQHGDQNVRENNKIDTVPPKTDFAIYKSNVIIKTQDTSKILVVIDGKEKGVMSDFKKLDQLIKPEDIQSINVLKGKTAIDKYGEKGKNGVIEILTKRNTEKADDDNKVFVKLEVEPSFPAGEREWRRYLEKYLDAGVPQKNGCKSGSFTVIVQFIVDKEGNISDLKPLTEYGYGMEEEVIRVIKAGPKWTPGMQNGKTVKAYKKQPVTFVIGNGEPNHTTDVSNKIGEKNILNEIVVTGFDNDENMVFEKVQIEASFPGGEKAWRNFLEKSLNANAPAENGAKNGVYTIIAQFIVHKDGTITDLRVLTNHGYGLETEVLRVMKLSPNWKPALQNGRPVTAYRKQQITFVVSNE